MGKFEEYYKVSHEDKYYGVSSLTYNSKKAPIILDWEIFKQIKKLNKNWYINEKGYVVTNHKYEEEGIEKVREVPLHDLVMKMSDGEIRPKSVIHINRLGVDNRRINLNYDTSDKEITKNLKKKKRTVILPEECGIDSNEIPSYVWYLKEDSTHGERFMIDVGDVRWKSTSSKKVSLKYKLEETKKYMRYLKRSRPDLFDEYSMNGDLNENGLMLIEEFIKIAEKAGFILNKEVRNNNTEKFIKEDLNGMSDDEIMLLELFNPEGERHDFR